VALFQNFLGYLRQHIPAGSEWAAYFVAQGRFILRRNDSRSECGKMAAQTVDAGRTPTKCRDLESVFQ